MMANTQQDRVLSMPDFFLPLTVSPGAHLIVHPLGGTAQGQFAQGDQVTFAKEILDRAFGLAGQINFAFVQALTEVVRR